MPKQRCRLARIVLTCNAGTTSFALICADYSSGETVVDKKLLQHCAGVVAHEPLIRSGHASKGIPSDRLVYCHRKNKTCRLAGAIHSGEGPSPRQ